MMRFAGLLASLFLLAGCASVVRGTSEAVQFDSEPPGAEMRSIVDYPCGGPCPTNQQGGAGGSAYVESDVKTPVENGPACVTPCVAEVKRNQALIVTFSKAGYEPQTVKLGVQVSGGGAAGVAGNVLVGGGVGMLVDAGTGAGMDHHPNPLKVTLQPIRQAAPAAARKPRR